MRVPVHLTRVLVPSIAEMTTQVAKRKEPPGRSRLFRWVELLRRCGSGDGLRAKGNDLGTGHFARDD